MNWKEVFDETVGICEQDPQYTGYAAREKTLAFIYTFLQQLNKNKNSYAPVLKKSNPLFLVHAATLHELKESFDAYTEELLFHATHTGEVQPRPLVSAYYKGLMWTVFVFILNYWARDPSENQEKTDVFVEKGVNFVFDIMSPGMMDSGIDLVRFLFQLRKSD